MREEGEREVKDRKREGRRGGGKDREREEGREKNEGKKRGRRE